MTQSKSSIASDIICDLLLMLKMETGREQPGCQVKSALREMYLLEESLPIVKSQSHHFLSVGLC